MDVLQLVVAVLLLAVAGLFGYRTSVGSKHRQARLPPKASGVPGIGDTFTAISKGPRDTSLPHIKKHGNFYRAWLFGEDVIHIADAEAIKLILRSEHSLVELEWPTTIAQLVGKKAIASMQGHAHLHARKTAGSAFTQKDSTCCRLLMSMRPLRHMAYRQPFLVVYIVQFFAHGLFQTVSTLQAANVYIPRTVEIAEAMCAEWAQAKHVKGADEMRAFTFRVANELVVGFPISFVTKDLLRRHKQLWADWLGGFIALPFNLPGFAFHTAMKARNQLQLEYQENINRLREREGRPEEGRIKSSMQIYVESHIQDAKERGEEVDMEQLADVGLNLLFAGHDTTASTLMLLLRFLKQEPRALQKLRKEQREIVAEYGTGIGADTLSKMPYTDAVIKEVLRLGDIVAVLTRRARQTFEVGGYTIPEGYRLQLEMWRIHDQDPRWAGQTGELAPAKFNPDRWMSEEGHKVGNWLPFGSGLRMCLGYIFAIQEVKIMLAVLARGYDWDLNLNERIKTFPLPAAVDGLPMSFRKLVLQKLSTEE